MTFRFRVASGRSAAQLGAGALLLVTLWFAGCDGGPDPVPEPASEGASSEARGGGRDGRARAPVAPTTALSATEGGNPAGNGVAAAAGPSEEVAERDGIRVFRGETVEAWVEKLRRREEREAAAGALRLLQPSDPGSVEALLSAAADEERLVVWRAIVDALASLVPYAEPQLAAEARSGTGRRRLGAIEALGRAASVQDPTFRLLEELSLPERGSDVVMTAAEALGRRVLGDEPSGDALRVALGDPRWAVRQRAVISIYGDRRRMREFETDLLRVLDTESHAPTRDLIRTTLREIGGMRPPVDGGVESTPSEVAGAGIPTRPGAIDPSPERSPLVLTAVPRDGVAGTPVETSSRAPVDIAVELSGVRVREPNFPALKVASGDDGGLHFRAVRLQGSQAAGAADVVVDGHSSSFDFREAKRSAGFRLMVPEPAAATRARAREYLRSNGFVAATEEELARTPKTEAEIARRATFDRTVAVNRRNAVGTFRIHVEFRVPGLPPLQAEPLVVTFRDDG